MKVRSIIQLCVVMMSVSLTAVAALPVDGGGRDVSVALFSTHTLHTVTITPLGSNSWTSRCTNCAHRPLTAPLHLAPPADIFAGGTLRVSDDATGDSRTATGLWHLRSSGAEIDVVLTIPSERYVTAVLNAEAAPGEPPQSMRALAILARTYALNGRHYTAAQGHLPADLCDSTACQAMRLEPASQAIEEATQATAGETLWFGAHRAETFFSQSCGGITEDAGAVWPQLRGLPYLRSHPDPYCLRKDTAAWHTEVQLARFSAIARAEGWRVPAKIVAARVIERSTSHRALRVQFEDSDGAATAISASALRFGIGRALGWDRVRSDAYELGVRNDALVFDGRGHGHGVGLCQQGATQMASEGKSTREILAFYFPGTTVRISPNDEGWSQTLAGPLDLRATHPLSTDRMAALQQLWAEAQQRFPPRRTIAPKIVFAPTTEVFRQLTSMPGWTLASTRGNTIVLQPEAILQAHGPGSSAILRHEMLHVLVESECSAHTPLWLREGFVEELAGERDASAKSMPVAAIETAMQHPDSLNASRRAHLASAARVHGLVARYGLSTVRRWLSAGAPPGVE